MPELRTYRLIRNRSRLWAEVKATLQEIRIEAGDFDGEFELPVEGDRLAPGAVTHGCIRLPSTALDGGNRLFNRDLHRTIESRKYREVVGDIRKIVASTLPDEFQVHGELRLHGGRSAVQGRVKVEYPDARHIRLTGESSFDINEHGIQPRRLLVLSVVPEVRFFGDVVAAAVDA